MVILHGDQAGSDRRKLCRGHLTARIILRSSARLTARGREENMVRTQAALRSSKQRIIQVSSEVLGIMNLI